VQELVEYRAKYFMGPGQAPPPILALGLSSRKNLCVHPAVAGGPSNRQAEPGAAACPGSMLAHAVDCHQGPALRCWEAALEA
jgi:hypothetical protein